MTQYVCRVLAVKRVTDQQVTGLRTPMNRSETIADKVGYTWLLSLCLLSDILIYKS